MAKGDPLLRGGCEVVNLAPSGEVEHDLNQERASERARQQMVRRMNKVRSPSSAELIERHGDRYGL